MKNDLVKKLGYYAGVIFAGSVFVCSMVCIFGLTFKFLNWLFG